MSRPFYFRERLKLQVFVAVLWLVIPLLASQSRLEVDYSSFSYVFYFSAAFYVVALLMITIRDRYVAPIAEVLAAGFALLVPMFIVTYLAYTFDVPLADKRLAAMDAGLGFDWASLIQFVDSTKWLASFLEFSYNSLKYQLVLVPVLLCILGQIPRAIAFIFGYALMVMIASALAVPFPALGTYTHYGFDASTLQNIDAKFGYHFLNEFNALRSASSHSLSGGNVVGIITFPSVHAGMGFFIIWTMWQTKWIKWPFVALNLSMAVSAVTHANHYLVDVIGGLGVACVVALLSGFVILRARDSSFQRTEAQAT